MLLHPNIRIWKPSVHRRRTRPGSVSTVVQHLKLFSKVRRQRRYLNEHSDHTTPNLQKTKNTLLQMSGMPTFPERKNNQDHIQMISSSSLWAECQKIRTKVRIFQNTCRHTMTHIELTRERYISRGLSLNTHRCPDTVWNCCHRWNLLSTSCCCSAAEKGKKISWKSDLLQLCPYNRSLSSHTHTHTPTNKHTYIPDYAVCSCLLSLLQSD